MIPKDDKVSFEDWAKELQQLKEKKFDRCYSREKLYSVDLHIFSYACSESMCVVAIAEQRLTNVLMSVFYLEKVQLRPWSRKLHRNANYKHFLCREIEAAHSRGSLHKYWEGVLFDRIFDSASGSFRSKENR